MPHALRVVNAIPDDDCVVGVEGFRPLIPDASYEAKYIGHETALVFKAAKCFLHFEIVQPGEHMGLQLFRAFRVRRLYGRPGKLGKFIPHAHGDLYVLLTKLLDIKLRADRITLRPLRHMLFKVRTRTVTLDHEQRERPEHLRYSVISDIERGE